MPHFAPFEVPVSDLDCYSRWRHVPPLPSLGLMATLGAPNLENFFVVGDAWFHIISEYLTAESSIVDVGCGCGRHTRYLLPLQGISYLGFDLLRPAIEWCKSRLEVLDPSRINFVHFDGHSSLFNPHGKIASTEFTFPRDDASTDVVIAVAVFVHLLEPVASHYLREIHRVLAPDGHAVVSIHDTPVAGSRYSGNERRIDVDFRYFVSLVHSAGLRVSRDLGDVCGQRGLVLSRAPL